MENRKLEKDKQKKNKKIMDWQTDKVIYRTYIQKLKEYEKKKFYAITKKSRNLSTHVYIYGFCSLTDRATNE